MWTPSAPDYHSPVVPFRPDNLVVPGEAVLELPSVAALLGVDRVEEAPYPKRPPSQGVNRRCGHCDVAGYMVVCWNCGRDDQLIREGAWFEDVRGGTLVTVAELMAD